VAATTCCDPVASAPPCGGSLAAAALFAALDTLDERRLVGTDVPDLSTLAGARSGTIGASLNSNPLKPEHLEKRLLTSRWRSPAFSSSRARWTPWRRPASSLQHPRRLRGARRLFCGPPGGERFRARPGHLLLCHLRSSQ
jgi:hypothetical protein